MMRTFIIAFFDADYKHISFAFISLLKFMRFSRKSQQIFVNFCVEKCCFPVLVCGVWVVWGDTKERPLSQAYGLPAPLLGELNLDRTKELVELAHSKGMSIEAEVGGIGGTEDGVTSSGELADPAECKQIADLGVDFLACGIGNIHGVYPADWAGLSFERLGEIKAQTGDLPLVLHGGTGIPEDQIKKAISLGISKINVNTDLQLVFAKGVREYIEAGKDQQGKGFDPRKLLKPGRDNIVARTKELMEEFGSVNKA